MAGEQSETSPYVTEFEPVDGDDGIVESGSPLTQRTKDLVVVSCDACGKRGRIGEPAAIEASGYGDGPARPLHCGECGS
jgi:hypothetical protein